MLKKPRLVRVKGWETMLKLYVKEFKVKNTHQTLKLSKAKAKITAFHESLQITEAVTQMCQNSCSGKFEEILRKTSEVVYLFRF